MNSTHGPIAVGPPTPQLIYRVIIVLFRQTRRLDVFVKDETSAELENGNVVFLGVLVVRVMHNQTRNVNSLLRTIKNIPHAGAA